MAANGKRLIVIGRSRYQPKARFQFQMVIEFIGYGFKFIDYNK